MYKVWNNERNSFVIREKNEFAQSILLIPRSNTDNCTHYLYRLPKTGSTALYNAVQEDRNLHKYVCWENDTNVHAIPLKSPIITVLRNPIDILRSYLIMPGWSKNRTTPVFAKKISTMNPLWNRKKTNQDIYLCNGDMHPPFHEQLRSYFKDNKIMEIPYENVNRRQRKIIMGRNKSLVDYVHKNDFSIWKAHCNSSELKSNHHHS